MCVGMKQVEVRVLIVQCLERDVILNKQYDTVSLCIIIYIQCVIAFGGPLESKYHKSKVCQCTVLLLVALIQHMHNTITQQQVE